jgi:hypothetical protein
MRNDLTERLARVKSNFLAKKYAGHFDAKDEKEKEVVIVL